MQIGKGLCARIADKAGGLHRLAGGVYAGRIAAEFAPFQHAAPRGFIGDARDETIQRLGGARTMLLFEKGLQMLSLKRQFRLKAGYKGIIVCTLITGQRGDHQFGLQHAHL